MASQGNGAFDRYAFVNNNPVRYTDPTGHCIFGLDTAFCVFAALVATTVLLTSDTSKIGIDYPKNGYMAGSEGLNCSSSLTGCFGEDVGLMAFSDNSEDNPIPLIEFEAFADEVAGDLYSHDQDWPGFAAGRQAYDTPFYNGGQSKERAKDPDAAKGKYPSNQQVCIESLGCSGRSEINYIAQGIWGADAGEPFFVTQGITLGWKLYEYGEWPSERTWFWLKYGYDYYPKWKEKNNYE